MFQKDFPLFYIYKFIIYFYTLHSVFEFRFEPASSHVVVGIFVICCGAS